MSGRLRILVHCTRYWYIAPLCLLIFNKKTKQNKKTARGPNPYDTNAIVRPTLTFYRKLPSAAQGRHTLSHRQTYTAAPVVHRGVTRLLCFCYQLPVLYITRYDMIAVVEVMVFVFFLYFKQVINKKYKVNTFLQNHALDIYYYCS